MDYDIFKKLKEPFDNIEQEKAKQEEENRKLEETKRAEEAFRRQELLLERQTEFLASLWKNSNTPTLPDKRDHVRTVPDSPAKYVTRDDMTKWKDDITSSVSTMIKDAISSTNPTERRLKAPAPNSGLPYHENNPKERRKALAKWVDIISDRCVKLKQKSLWLSELYAIAKTYNLYTNTNYDDMKKKDAIISLATDLAAFGSPSKQKPANYNSD
jgi:hypothetical protein